MNTHDEFKILISAYFDGEVSPAEKQQVEAHLKECESCRKNLLELQILSSSLKKWSDETPSPDLEQKINNRFSNKGEPPMKTSTLRITQMAGSVLVVLFLAMMTLQTVARNNMQARVRDANRYLTSAQLAKNPHEESEVRKEVDQLALSRQPVLQDKDVYSVKSKSSGALKSATDDIGDQYAPGNVSVRTNVKDSSTVGAVAMGSSATSQYEDRKSTRLNSSH